MIIMIIIKKDFDNTQSRNNGIDNIWSIIVAIVIICRCGSRQILLFLDDIRNSQLWHLEIDTNDDGVHISFRCHLKKENKQPQEVGVL